MVPTKTRKKMIQLQVNINFLPSQIYIILLSNCGLLPSCKKKEKRDEKKDSDTLNSRKR